MSLKGKIISINDNGIKAKVLVQPVPDCHGCQACAGIIKMSKAANSQCEIDVFTNNLTLHVGDTVKLELSEYQGSKVAFILYGIPILCFLAGMLVTPYICNTFGIPLSDLARVIGAFTGLFLSLLAIMVYIKASSKDTFMMTITEILPN